MDDPPATTRPVASVTVQAGKARLVGIGATVQLRAEARTATGRAVPGTAFTWRSSDAQVATVDAQGLVTTTGLGMVTIEAAAGTVVGTFGLEVLQDGAQALTVSAPQRVLPGPGTVVALALQARNILGETYDLTGEEVLWQSNRPEVAAVDAEGAVTTGIPGFVTITVQVGEAQDTITLEVIPTTGVGGTSLDLAMVKLLDQVNPPGMAVAAIKDGRLVMARGYGFADPHAEVPVAPTSLFRIASVSKPLTAVTTLRLIETGQLNLDDKVFAVIPEMVPAEGVADARVSAMTVEHLLTHWGGWDRNIGPNPMYSLRQIAQDRGVPSPPSRLEFARWILGQPLHFAPGARYVYNNVNYFMLGRIIATVTGMPYEDYVRAEILAPLGITRMQVGFSRRADQVEDEVVYHFTGASPSVFDDTPGLLPNAYGGLFDLQLMDASGGWLASAVDLARFALAVDGDPQTPEMLTAMTHAYMTTDHSGLGVYGAGWILDGGGFFHTGGLEGTNSILAIRNDGLTVVLLFNGNINIAFQQFIDPIAGVGRWPEEDLFDRF